jgi:hypothetical protein
MLTTEAVWWYERLARRPARLHELREGREEVDDLARAPDLAPRTARLVW